MKKKFVDSIIVLRFGKTKGAKEKCLLCEKTYKNLGCWY